MKYSVNKASEILGVSISTLRRWEDEGVLIAERTPGGHRRYDPTKLARFVDKKKTKRITIAYARVNSNEEDLKKQITNIETYCIANGYQFKIITDIGSGLIYNKKGIMKVVELVCNNQVERIVLNYRDRLIRFGFELFEEFAKYHEVTLEVINQTRDISYDEEMEEEMIEVISMLASNLYNTQKRKRHDFINQVKDIIRDYI